MKPSIALTAAVLIVSMSAGLRAAGNAHTAFTGGVGVANPCNGEGVGATGPVKIVYVEDDGHHVVHFTFKAAGVGEAGNSYLFTFAGNQQFEAPTSVSGNVSIFDMPVDGQVITKGGAPNFEWDLGVRIFVVDGKATGATFIGPATTTCHG
jgi:hypothetical protein